MDALRALVANPFSFAADAAYQVHLWRIGDALDGVANLIFDL